MPPRRFHSKSRRGCLTCKSRRVKCDEIGPPCTNCKYRQTACEYASPAAWPSHAEDASLIPCPRPASREPSRHFGSETNLSPERLRNLELQLLHRWSTVTYDSIATEATGDWEIWQKTVPEIALKHDFLLNILFALSAFEMAFSCPKAAPKYLSVALKYQGSALRGFHDQLQTLVDRRTSDSDHTDIEENERRRQVVTSLAEYLDADESQIKQENIQTLGMKLDGEEHGTMLYASILLMALTLASATAGSPSLLSPTAGVERDSTIQRTIAHYNLVRSINIVIMSKPDCITTHKLFRNIPQIYKPKKVSLEDDVEWIMETLSTLNEERLKPCDTQPSDAASVSWLDATEVSHQNKNSPERPLYDLNAEENGFNDMKNLASALDDSLGSTSPYYTACKNALILLKYMFETRLDKKLQHHCLAWLNMAGKEYVQAVEDGDRPALLILVGWAVLMQTLGKTLWYVKDFGKLLIQEIGQILRDDDDQQVSEVLDWAKRELDEAGNIDHRWHDSKEVEES